METIGLKETSRRCCDPKCGAKLKDSVLDWEVIKKRGLDILVFCDLSQLEGTHIPFSSLDFMTK